VQEITTGRIIIVGAGLGALYAALCLAPRPVLLISPDPLGSGASSAWAQGGVAAAMAQADSPEAHALDTIAAGAGTVEARVAATVTEEARAHILALTDFGTAFDRSADGGYVMSREAAHSFARVVRVQGDQAGAEIMRALIERVRNTPSIQVLEGVLARGLDSDGSKVTGVEIELARAEGSAPALLRGAGVLLAGGGSGGLYALTTNPARIRGQVIGMAARAGALIADAEFVQFHPTAIDCGEDPAPLATEALRGAGAHLINSEGARFMTEVHPLAELAPRDIVARAIFAQTQAGLRPMLDTRAALGPAVLAEYPAVAAACARNGIDPVIQPIPVAAAAHYHMGGVATDAHGRSSLAGLWVCGEASSTGLHGANRLASNGLLEALVFARRAAQDMLEECSTGDSGAVTLPNLPAGETPDETLVAQLRQTMTAHVGVLRDAEGLQRALATIAQIEAAQPHCAQLQNMTATATLITAAALARRESRGAHCRTDYPDTLPEAARSFLTLAEATAFRSNPEELPA
jgi:L-aspartate oxidase